jgi:uncharacterized protein (TIGR00730 family)
MEEREMNYFKRLKICIRLMYSLTHVFFQIIYGAWRISKLSYPRISIFGSARVTQADKYAKEANQLAEWFVEQEISVLTGGGPGIMEAANCGAVRKKHPKKDIHSVGIGVSGLNEPKNVCAQEYFELDYFFARKWLLTQYSTGFVVFPGGFGTLDELFDVLTLIQTNHMKKVPIVLIGSDYWNPLVDWMRNEFIEKAFVSKEQLELIVVTDDPYKAFCFVQGKCKID